MKKIFPILLGVIGLGLIGYSVMNGWASFTQSSQFGMGIAIEPTTGIELWQGIAALVLGIVGFALIFIKPKMAAIPAILAAGAALMVKISPPLLVDEPMDPQKAIYFAIAGAVLIAVAGLMAPKRA